MILVSTSRLGVDAAKFKQNVTDLTLDLMTMQATGDFAAAKQLLDQMARVRPQTQAILDKLKNVPVDIEPRFATADELLR